MSAGARKARDRIARLRERSVNDIAVWDDGMHLDHNAVFVQADDVEGFLDRMEACIKRARLDKLDHQIIDGGVVVRFRRKRDADLFRVMTK